jgi:hypothetical protein
MPNFYNRIKARKFTSVSDTAVEISPYNSATPNFSIDAGGKLNWSSGSATADTNLYRSSANVLKTDDSFDVASGKTYKIDGTDVLSSTSLGSSVVGSSLTSVGSLTGLTAATPNFTGPLTSSGAATFSSSVTVAGNLTVNGTTTTVNSITLTVDDKNIELGSVDTPTNTTADGGGITLKGTTDKTITWDNSATPSWNLSENLNLVSGKTVKINNTDVLTPSNILGSATSASIGASTGTTTVNNGLVIKQVIETTTIDSTTNLSALATNVDVLTSSIYYFSGTPSANFAINIRGNSSVTNLNDILSTGQTLTISIIVDRAANTYKLSTVNINGSSQTINWFGGTAPSAGNALDIYSITVLKTAASTYKVFASQAKFA